MHPEEVALINKCANANYRHYFRQDLASEDDNEHYGSNDRDNCDQIKNSSRCRYRKKHACVVGDNEEG